MPLVDKGDAKLWRRDPMQQNVARDLIAMEATFMRACTASREYSIVKVPIVSYDIDTDKIELDLSKCTESERRFVIENITPREFEYAERGEAIPELDRSR